MNELAVVIPAFRARFLQSALTSLAAQTDRRFTVYVGDDASPDDVRGVCQAWQGTLDLRYTRFERNLGGQDLVAQWMRCIALSDEPWVWLFSDDDELEPECVEAWRAARRQNPNTPLFHFDVRRIDADSNVLSETPPFPDGLTARAFVLARLQGRLASFAPDYVFERAALDAAGGFKSFPMAWCSDDATWFMLANVGGICPVRGPRVRWRLSGSNISSSGSGHGNAKVVASVMYLEWLQQQLRHVPASAGDPHDAEILRAGRHWLFQQARMGGGRFGWSGAFRAAMRLRRVPGLGWWGTLLRAWRSDLELMVQRSSSR